MPLGTVLELVTRTDTKFGNVDAALANKLDPPIHGGTFDPTLIDLSLGQVEYENYTQTGAIAFALDPAKTPAVGGSVAVNITGGGAAITYPSGFIGLDGLISGAILDAGVDYTFLFRHAEDWAEVAPGVFEDRVLVVASGLRLINAGTFAPTAVNLTGVLEYVPYTQAGAVAFALADITEVAGSYITVQFTGDGSAITWSSDFAEIQGGDLTAGDYAGFTGSRRLMVIWSAAQGKALVALSGESDASMTATEILAALLTVDGAASGLDSDLLDGQHGAWYRDRANHTGTQPMASIASPSEVVLATLGSHTLGSANHHALVLARPATALGQIDCVVDGTAAAPFACELVHDDASGVLTIDGSNKFSSAGLAVPWNPSAKLFLSPRSVVSVRRHASGRAYISGPVRQLTTEAALDPESLNGVGGIEVMGWHMNRSTIGTATGISSISSRIFSGMNLAQATGANQPTAVGTPGEQDYGARLLDAGDEMLTPTTGTLPSMLGTDFALIFVWSGWVAESVSNSNMVVFGNGETVTGRAVSFRNTGTNFSLSFFNPAQESRSALLPSTVLDGGKTVFICNVSLEGVVCQPRYYFYHETQGYIHRHKPTSFTPHVDGGSSGRTLTISRHISWTFHAAYRIKGVITEAQVERLMRFCVNNDWMTGVGAI